MSQFRPIIQIWAKIVIVIFSCSLGNLTYCFKVFSIGLQITEGGLRILSKFVSFLVKRSV